MGAARKRCRTPHARMLETSRLQPGSGPDGIHRVASAASGSPGSTAAHAGTSRVHDPNQPPRETPDVMFGRRRHIPRLDSCLPRNGVHPQVRAVGAVETLTGLQSDFPQSWSAGFRRSGRLICDKNNQQTLSSSPIVPDKGTRGGGREPIIPDMEHITNPAQPQRAAALLLNLPQWQGS